MVTVSQNPRALRLADQIQYEISDIIRNKIRDPRKGFITITAVEMTDDLRAAKVFFSALGNPTDEPEGDLEKARALLEHARGFIRTELGHRLKVRFVPDLLFKSDKSAFTGLQMDRLLHDLREGKRPAEAEDDEDLS